MCSFCWQKCGLRPKLFLPQIYFQRSGVFLHWFSHMCLTLLLAYMRNRRIFMAKCVNELAPRALWFVMASIIKVRLKFLTFFFLPFKYPWLRSHDFMYIFKSGKSVCVTVCRSGYQCLIIWAILARRATPPRHVYMANCHPGWQGYPTWQTGQPAWAGHPTYHVNVIKIK